MAKHKVNKVLPQSSINLNVYSIYKENKDNTIVYRCKFCRHSRIKKSGEIYFAISGHKHNCKVIKKFRKQEEYPTIKINENKRNKSSFKVKKENKMIKENGKIFKFDNDDEGNNEPDYDNLINYDDASQIKSKETDIIKQNIESTKIFFSFCSININAPENMDILCKELCKDYSMSIYSGLKYYSLFANFKLGSGTFGICYFGIYKPKNIPCAIKISKKEEDDDLDKEAEFLREFYDIDFFPKLISLEKNKKIQPCLAQEIMGPNLRKLVKFCDNLIDVKTLCNIGKDIITSLQAIHKKNILHGDIRPSNICWNILDNENIHPDLVLIDFGFSEYIEDIKGKKIPENDYYKAVGLIEDIKLSKKKEILVVLYILYNLYTGELPWIKNRKSNKNKGESKINIKENFNFPNELPEEIKEISKIYFKVINLKDDEEPEYINYQYILTDINEKQNKNHDENFRFLWEQKIIEIFQEAEYLKNPTNVKEKIYDFLFFGYPKQFINFAIKKKYMNKKI
jgi:hypothetical protein